MEFAGLEELQQLFDAVAPKWYRRTEGSQASPFAVHGESGAESQRCPVLPELAERLHADHEPRVQDPAHVTK